MALWCNSRTRFASIWLFHGNVPFHQRRKRYIFHLESRSSFSCAHTQTHSRNTQNRIISFAALLRSLMASPTTTKCGDSRQGHRTECVPNTHSPKEKLWNTMWTAVVVLMHYSLSLFHSLCAEHWWTSQRGPDGRYNNFIQYFCAIIKHAASMTWIFMATFSSAMNVRDVIARCTTSHTHTLQQERTSCWRQFSLE